MSDILKTEDVFLMLDQKLKKIGWDKFYTERKRPAPFLKYSNLPDENLKEYFEMGKIKRGKALELGCGEGRNAIYLTQQGCKVTAADSSEVAIRNARRIAENRGLKVNFLCEDIFGLRLKGVLFDLVYDSGLFHHLAPHRRLTYLELISSVLKSGGFYGLVCFASGEDIADEVDDYEFYEKPRSGVAFTEEKLQKLFSPSFEIMEIRKMKPDIPGTLQESGFLWTMLCCRK